MVHVSEAAEIRKNETEIVCIEPANFRGKNMIDVRVWYEAEPGVHKPTKKGLCLQPQTWREVVDAMEDLLRNAESDGGSE